MSIIPDSIFLHLAVLAASFFLLARAAGFLVDGAVGIATAFGVPKLVIGIVLVGFATTAPEFAVSVISALRGFPEIALGNAVGSVIVDDGFALALGIVIAPAAIRVEPRMLRWFGLFLVGVDVLAFCLSLNGIIARWEGMLLVGILLAYLAAVVTQERRRRRRGGAGLPSPVDAAEVEGHVKQGGAGLQALRFLGGVAGVVIGSEFLIDSSVFVAGYFGASKAVIGLTVVAIGTSLPEIATCVVAFRRGHGELAFGDIIGADILNVLWIVGAASIANPIEVERRVILFAFPWMLAIVVTMLLLARLGYRLERWKGGMLMAMYGAYLALTILLFYS